MEDQLVCIHDSTQLHFDTRCSHSYIHITENSRLSIKILGEPLSNLTSGNYLLVPILVISDSFILHK